MKKNTKRKAFTLVELLVVIAIVAVLATVTVIGYSSFIKKAEDSKVVQEAKNAYIAYVGENFGNGEIAEYMVYNTDGSFVALHNGTVIGVYADQATALVAMGLDPDGGLDNLMDGKLWAYNGILPSFFDLSDKFKQMIQPSWIDYGGGGKAGVANFNNTNSSSQSHKCGVGHAIYLCNRTFTFSNSEDYEIVVVKMDKDLNIIENTGWLKGPYTVNKGECAWFSIILRSTDQSSIKDKLAEVALELTVTVSREEIDKGSDFPLVLAIMDFTSDGTMSMGSTFTKYTDFKTLCLAYPITNEEKVEQTTRLSTWNQSLRTYNATSGAISQNPKFYNTMTWVATLDNENLFVLWRKADNSVITYDEAIEMCKSITVRKANDENNENRVMNIDSEFKVMSHRIDAQLAPRNTYSALVSAYNRGYRWFESDIHLTKDLVPVMLHDRNISDVSNGNVNIDSITYEEALQYDFGSWHSPKYVGEKILRLEDMLKFCSEHGCGLSLEFKSTSVPAWNIDTMKIVYDLIQEYGMEDRVMFNGNGDNEFEYLKMYLEHFDSTAEVQWLPGSLTDANINKAKTLLTGNNVVRICVPWGNGISKDLIDSAANQGILVDAHCVTTVDSIKPSVYKEMLLVGISGIITESANTTFYEAEQN